MAISPRTYLESLRQHDRFKDCREFYTSTQAQIQLQVQTCLEGEKRSPGELGQSQKHEPPFEVILGLQRYVKQHCHVLLIGKPGSGKTTALRRLAWECLSAWSSRARNHLFPIRTWSKREENHPFPIPVFVELRGLKGESSESVLRWIKEAFENYEQELSLEELQELLRKKELLLLFDGLNELPTPESWNALDGFRERYPKVPMIFTTRELGAGSNLGIEKKLEMVSLTEPQMREFIQKRLGRRADELLRQMGDRLRELAETPLLLKMLCDVFTPEQPIPQNRGELFRLFVRRYDEEHKRKKQYEAIASPSFYQFRDEILRQLAVEMMHGGETPIDFLLRIDKNQAENLIESSLKQRGETDPATKAKSWLEDLIEHHLLQLAPNPDQIEFHHQLFQEYYAAEWLLENLSNFLKDEKSQIRLKYQYLNYLKWTEVIFLVQSLISSKTQSVQLVQLALETDLLLGAKLAGQTRIEFQQAAIDLIWQLSSSSLMTEDSCNATSQREDLSRFKIQLLKTTRSSSAIHYLNQVVSTENHDDFESAYLALEAIGTIGGEEAIQSLVAHIKSSIPDVRIGAACWLGEIGDERAIPKLKQVLEDPDVCEAAIEALGRIGGEAATILIEALEQAAFIKDDYPNIHHIANALKNIGGEPVFSALVRALNFKGYYSYSEFHGDIALLKFRDFYVREDICEALIHVGGERAISELIKVIVDGNINTQAVAIEAIGKTGDKRIVPVLRNMIKDFYFVHRTNRLAILRALGEIKDRTTMPALLQLCVEEDWMTREQAIKTVAEIDSEQAIPILIRALGDDVESIRDCASELLKEFGGKQAIPHLIEALTLENSEVKEQAIKILGHIADKSAVLSLISMLESSSPKVCASAAWALGRIGETEPVIELLKLTEHGDKEVRQQAIQALGEIGDTRAIEALLKAVNDDAQEVRKNAVFGLRKFKTEETVQLLLTILEHRYVDVLTCAVMALGDMGIQEAIPLLTEMLDDELEESLSFSVVISLEEIGGKEVIPGLVKALKSKSSIARSSAMRKLIRIADQSMILSLIDTITDQDLYRNSALVLEETASPEAISKLWEMVIKGYLDFETIETIQSRCGFYNYELYQLARSQKGEVDQKDVIAQNIQNIYVDSVGNLMTGPVIVEGNQIGIQNNNTQDKKE